MAVADGQSPRDLSRVLDGFVREASTCAPATTVARPTIAEPPIAPPGRRPVRRSPRAASPARPERAASSCSSPPASSGRRLPLVVMLHGCTQNPDDFAAGTRMNALAQEQGLLRPLPGAGAALERAQVLELVPRRRPAARPGRAGAARRHDAPRHGDAHAIDRRSGLRRRPLGRRRDGGDPGARVPRPVRRRRRPFRRAARRRARRRLGVLGDEDRPAAARSPRARPGRGRADDRLPRRRRQHRPRPQRQPS